MSDQNSRQKDSGVAMQQQKQDPTNESASGEIVVLTGSSGCLGQQTLKLLISHDDKVAEIRCLDLVELSEHKRRSIQIELDKLEAASSDQQANNGRNNRKKIVKFITGDIRDINTVEACLDGAHCVLHCAAKTDIWTNPDEQDQTELESINVQGTENLLKACVRFGVAKFVHVSSFETFVSYHTIYYATESTLPEPKWLLFGPSGDTKREAENRVRYYSNTKLNRQQTLGQCHKDSLNAVIIRFTQIYGPEDKYFVSRILRIAKYFNGTLRRFSHVWIRQQPIYVGNAAWSLIKAKQRMDTDESISGEDFHITDDTRIGDPFDFLEPFLASKDMRLTKSAWPAWPLWLLMILVTFCWKTIRSLDFLGLVTCKKSLVDQAKEKDKAQRQQRLQQRSDNSDSTWTPITTATNNNLNRTVSTSLKWYNLITPQAFYFMCNSLFLNRTKANLRLDYEPLFDAQESMRLALDWYKNELQL